MDLGNGISSFKLMPGTGENVIVANYNKTLKNGSYETYLIIFDVRFNILMPSVLIAYQKYEGFELI